MGNNNPKIKGAPIKGDLGRPANFSNPQHFKGNVKSVGFIKGHGNTGIERKSEYFMKSQASGPETIREAKGFNLA